MSEDKIIEQTYEIEIKVVEKRLVEEGTGEYNKTHRVYRTAEALRVEFKADDIQDLIGTATSHLNVFGGNHVG